MQRHRIPFVHRLVVGVVTAALAGCSSAGTITDGNGTTGRDSKGGDNAGGNGILPQPSATKPGAPAGKTGPKWVISMPDSIAGFPRVEPDSQTIQGYDSQMRTAYQIPGVTGQTMRGIYDDARDDYYLVVYGVNGSGINPADVVSTDNAQKGVDNQANPNITVQFSRVDPGPHGGDDSCAYSTIVQPFDGGTIVNKDTTCMWSTTTTAGSIAFVDKGDLKQTGYNGAVTPTIAGQVLLAVRDAVEHQQA